MGVVESVISTVLDVFRTTTTIIDSVNQAKEAKKTRKLMEQQAQEGVKKVNPLTRDQLLAGNQSVLSSENTATSAGRGRLLGN